MKRTPWSFNNKKQQLKKIQNMSFCLILSMIEIRKNFIFLSIIKLSAFQLGMDKLEGVTIRILQMYQNMKLLIQGKIHLFLLLINRKISMKSISKMVRQKEKIEIIEKSQEQGRLSDLSWMKKLGILLQLVRKAYIVFGLMEIILLL